MARWQYPTKVQPITFVADPVVSTDQGTGANDSGQIGDIKLLQYVSVVGPVVVPTAVVTPEFSWYRQTSEPTRTRAIPAAAQLTGDWGMEFHQEQIMDWAGRQHEIPSRRSVPAALVPTSKVEQIVVATIPSFDWWIQSPTAPPRVYRPVATIAHTLQHNPTEGFDWKGYYPDGINSRSLPVAAMPTGMFGADFPSTIVPLTWEPYYPDRHTYRRPADFPALSWVPQHNPSEGFQLDWKGVYPDFISRKTLPTAAIDFGGLRVDTSVTPTLPPLTWEPFFPDLIARRTITASLIPTGMFGADFSATIVPLTWKPTYPDFHQYRRTAEFQTLAFTPAHSAAEGAAQDWTPRYVDWIFRPRVRAVDTLPFVIYPVTPAAQYIGWYIQHPTAPPIRRTPETGATYVVQHNPAEGSALDWEPTFVDSIFRFKPLAANQLAFSMWPIPIINPIVGAIDWYVQHPTAPPQQHRPFAGATYTSQHNPSEGQNMDWLSRFVDRIDRPTLNPSRIPSLTLPLSEPATGIAWYLQGPTPIRPRTNQPPQNHLVRDITATVTDLKWAAKFVDFIPRKKAHPSLLFFGDWGMELAPPAVVDIAWARQHPTPVWKRTHRTALQYFGDWGMELQVAPPLSPSVGSWRPRYPDWIARKPGLHASRAPWQGVQPHNALKIGAVSVSYPDEIFPKRGPHASRQRAFFGERFEPQPTTLTFHGKLPDLVPRKKIHPSAMQFLALGRDGSSGLPAPFLAWDPTYPDFITRAKTLPLGWYTTGFLFIPLVSVDPRFMGVFPSAINRRQTPAANQWSFGINLVPIPKPAVVALSWQPEYPDFAKGRSVHPAITPTTFRPLADQTFRFWFPTYPAQISRRAQAREGANARTIPIIAVPDIRGWYPSAFSPSWGRRTYPASMSQPPLGAQPGIASAQTWQPIMPSWLQCPRLLQTGQSLFPVQQASFYSQVDCIVMKDTNVDQPTMVFESVAGSTMTDESLTTPDHIGIQTC